MFFVNLQRDFIVSLRYFTAGKDEKCERKARLAGSVSARPVLIFPPNKSEFMVTSMEQIAVKYVLKRQ